MECYNADMNSDTTSGLKQFIAVTIAQQTSNIVEELRQDIKQLDGKLSAKIDDLSASVAEAMDSNNDATQKHLDTHEQCIAKLEPKTA